MPDEELLNPPRRSGCGFWPLVLAAVLAVPVGCCCVVGLLPIGGRKPASDAAVDEIAKGGPSQPQPEPPAPEPEQVSPDNLAPAPRVVLDGPPPLPPEPPPTVAPSVTPRPTPKSSSLPTAPKVAPKPDPVSVTAQGVTVTVRSLRRVDALGEIKPAKGESILVTDVEVVNSSGNPVRYGPRAFRLKDAGGRESAAVLKQHPGTLLTGELVKGGTVRGNVAFLASSWEGLTLVFQPTGAKESISLRLTK